MEIQVINNQLVVDNKRIEFSENIKAYFLIEDTCIVQLWNSMSDDISQQPINNVFSVNRECKVIWNIYDLIKKDGIYTKITISNGLLYLFEFLGRRYIIDLSNNSIIDDKAFK